MPGPAATLACLLAREAEAVCRHYLSNGRRAGRYWLVGDVRNSKGRSLYVRLTGPEAGPGAAGHWTDAATGQHGDLLDLIALNRGDLSVGDAIDEARRFLGQPRLVGAASPSPWHAEASSNAAQRLFRAARPIRGTAVETYLRERGITARMAQAPLRFHPACFYRPEKGGPIQRWPAMIAAVTDAAGAITGVQRTWLMGDEASPQRRAMGHLLGHGVRFGCAADILTAGEGIETMLSLRSVFRGLPCVAALSANHLAAFRPPAGTQCLYITRDQDAAGHQAAQRLAVRAAEMGMAALMLDPVLGDINDDLRRLGPAATRQNLLSQLRPEDAARFAGSLI